VRSCLAMYVTFLIQRPKVRLTSLGLLPLNTSSLTWEFTVTGTEGGHIPSLRARIQARPFLVDLHFIPMGP